MNSDGPAYWLQCSPAHHTRGRRPARARLPALDGRRVASAGGCDAVGVSGRDELVERSDGGGLIDRIGWLWVEVAEKIDGRELANIRRLGLKVYKRERRLRCNHVAGGGRLLPPAASGPTEQRKDGGGDLGARANADGIWVYGWKGLGPGVPFWGFGGWERGRRRLETAGKFVASTAAQMFTDGPLGNWNAFWRSVECATHNGRGGLARGTLGKAGHGEASSVDGELRCWSSTGDDLARGMNQSD